MKMWKIEILGVGGNKVHWVFASSLEGAKDTAKILYSVKEHEFVQVMEHEFFREQLIA